MRILEYNTAEARRWILVVLCIFVESLQLLIIAAMLSNYYPPHNEYFISQSFTKTLANLKIDRQVPLYQFFVFTNIMLAGVFVAWGREKIKNQQWMKGLLFYTVTQALLLVLQLFAVFKIVVYKSPAWAAHFLDIGVGLGILTRLFWPEVSRSLKVIYEKLSLNAAKPRVVRGFDVLTVLIIAGALYIPDLEKAVSRAFLWGRFIDWDKYLAGPGWAFLNGASLNRDALSPWGSAAPSLIAGLTKLTGSFDYIHIMACCVILVIIYFLATYLFLRLWLGSALLSLGGVLLAIKLQMFNTSTAPLIWLYPQKTCLRYLPDVFVLITLVQFSQKNDSKWLWLAAIGTGIALGYMPDTGFALLIAFYFYLFFSRIKIDLPKLLLVKLSLVPWLAGLGLLTLVQGAGIVDPHFWQNTFEPAYRLIAGLGTVPFYDCLRSLQFFAFVMAFIIPGVYVMTILSVCTLYYFDRVPRPHILAAVISIYGLGLYPCYLWQSSVDNYYTVGVPFVLVVCFWIKQAVDLVSPWGRSMILIAWAVLNGIALLTNQLFIYYPNVLNIAGYDWTSEKKLTQDNLNLDADAALIKQDTSADEGVVLISSFETQLLMKAGRRSFFKWVPLTNSVHMGALQFGGMAMETSDELLSTLQALEQLKPPRVFVEKKLIMGQLPREYYQYYQSLTALLIYCQQNYVLEKQGQYLLELKRR